MPLVNDAHSALAKHFLNLESAQNGAFADIVIADHSSPPDHVSNYRQRLDSARGPCEEPHSAGGADVKRCPFLLK